MKETKVTIKHSDGLHARPASIFVDRAQEFESAITVTFAGKEADAKSILSVLTLGIEQGDQLTLRGDGSDAQEALDSLTRLIEANFGDDSESGQT